MNEYDKKINEINTKIITLKNIENEFINDYFLPDGDNLYYNTLYNQIKEKCLILLTQTINDYSNNYIKNLRTINSNYNTIISLYNDIKSYNYTLSSLS